MEAILDELKQYDLKRIVDIENVRFKNNYTLNDKYYLYANIRDNVVTSLYVGKNIEKTDICGFFWVKNVHLYEIEHNFEIKNIYDIFYNFCLNNFVNPTTQIKRLYLYLRTDSENNNSITCNIINHKMFIGSNTIIISNLNELYLFHDVMSKHEIFTLVQVSFEQN